MKKKFLCGILTLGMMTSLISGCGSVTKNNNEVTKNETTETQKGHYPVIITNYTEDKKEYKITFNEKPKRVITTNQSPTELLLALGLEEYMVGTSYLDNPILPNLKEKYNKVPVLSAKYPSKEIIIAKKPDFIMGWSSAFSDKAVGSVEAWRDKGVHTFIQRNSGVAKDRIIENTYKDIEDIGKIFDVEDRAEKLIKSMKDTINEIQTKVKKSGKQVKVLALEGEGQNKFRMYGKKSLANDLIEKAGGINLEEKGGSYSVESIVQKNPDAIILIHFETQTGDNKEVEALLKNPALKNVNAIKDKKIIYTPLAEVYASGIRTIDGIKRFAKGFYPDLFK